MYCIGLTGGIGSGKSFAADFFSAQGITVVDADRLSRKVVDEDPNVRLAISQKFGCSILLSSGELDRKKLRALVFESDTKLAWLNQLLHPLIHKNILTHIKQSNSKYTILDVPLLFENKLEKLVSRVLVIDVPESIQINRAMLRDSVTKEDVQAIINKQVSRDFRLSRADDIVDNSGSKESTLQQLTSLHKKYFELASKNE